MKRFVSILFFLGLSLSISGYIPPPNQSEGAKNSHVQTQNLVRESENYSENYDEYFEKKDAGSITPYFSSVKIIRHENDPDKSGYITKNTPPFTIVLTLADSGYFNFSKKTL